jgi:hypothetical protein
MRRTALLISLLAVLAAGLAVAAAGLAGGGSDPTRPAAARPATPQDGPFALAAERGEARRLGRHRGGMGRGLHARLITDLAERLDVDDAELRGALRTVKGRARRDGVNLRTATPAQRAALKQRLAADLAGELGRSTDRVVAAVRAELEEALGVMLTFGAITERGRDVALACYDAPADCDLAALRREVRFRHHGGRR